MQKFLMSVAVFCVGLLLCPEYQSRDTTDSTLKTQVEGLLDEVRVLGVAVESAGGEVGKLRAELAERESVEAVVERLVSAKLKESEVTKEDGDAIPASEQPAAVEVVADDGYSGGSLGSGYGSSGTSYGYVVASPGYSQTIYSAASGGSTGSVQSPVRAAVRTAVKATARAATAPVRVIRSGIAVEAAKSPTVAPVPTDSILYPQSDCPGGVCGPQGTVTYGPRLFRPFARYRSW